MPLAASVPVPPPYPVAAYSAYATQQLPLAASQQARTPCLPASMMKGATVVSLSAYAARGQREPFKLAGSNYSVNALRVVGHGKEPLVLVVTAYEPVLWDPGAVANRIRAVVASGYYPQALEGVSKATAIRFSSSVGNFDGSETCARIHYAYDSTGDIASQADEIEKAIGRAPRRFSGAYSTDSLDVDGDETADAARQEISQIKASVPLITEDDPANTGMSMLPDTDRPGDRRIVEWNEAGRIVRDEGGRRPDPRAEDDLTSVGRSPQPQRIRSSGIGFIPSLLVIAMLLFGLSRWRGFRWNKSVVSRPGTGDRPQGPEERIPARIRTEKVSPPPFAKQGAELLELAALTDLEELVVALHRLGREIQNLPKVAFDSDIRIEVRTIIEQHFEHAIARYRQVRPSLGGEEARHADELLAPALDRLAHRLNDLRSEQHRRDVTAVDEAARFIDARHPE
jgi:hypothetical protein